MADSRHSPTPDYQPGQMVWLSTKDLPLQVDSHKLAPRYIGPFKVVKIINPSPIRLKLPNSLKVHPAFHVLSQPWLQLQAPLSVFSFPGFSFHQQEGMISSPDTPVFYLFLITFHV